MHNIKILIVEDDADAREILVTFLSRWGYNVQTVANGYSAAKLLEEETFDMVLLDWELPGISGIELCEQIRKQSKQQYIYTIMVTAKKDKMDMLTGFEKGADDYIVKPFNFQEMKARVRSGERIIKLEKRLRSAYDKLYKVATLDPLTGVLNRGAILELFEKEVKRGRRIGQPVGFIICDLDDFKKVNDTYGHLVGDDVLCEVCEIIAASLRNYDAVGRYGGEEFVMVLPGLNTAESAEVAERIRSSIASNPLHIKSINLNVTASFGVCSTLPNEIDPPSITQIIDSADKSLYQSKSSGKNKVIVAEPVQIS